MLKNLPLEHQVGSGEGLRTPTLPRGRSWQPATRSLESTPFSHHRLIRQIGLVTIAVINPRALAHRPSHSRNTPAPPSEPRARSDSGTEAEALASRRAAPILPTPPIFSLHLHVILQPVGVRAWRPVSAVWLVRSRVCSETTTRSLRISTGFVGLESSLPPSHTARPTEDR